MGKDRDFIDEEGSSLLNEERKFKLRKRKFRANCPHCSKKGKSLLASNGTEDVHVCQRKGCGVVIDYRPYTRADNTGIDTLKTQVAGVRNALEICKHRAANDGENKGSQEIIARCANLIMELEAVPDLMEALMDTHKDKKNKKEHKRHTIDMGLGSLAFGKKSKSKGGW